MYINNKNLSKKSIPHGKEAEGIGEKWKTREMEADGQRSHQT
jgi:hypothetical protein